MTDRRKVVITTAKRTPIGKFLGSLSCVGAADLGVSVTRAVLEQSGIDPARVGEVIFGCARQAGVGPNIARQISIRAGVPEASPAFTVNQACGSGLRAVILAADAIARGDCDVALAGGTESMSSVPFLLDGMRRGYAQGDGEVLDAMYRDGFLCPLSMQVMGETAETLADRYEISRQEQDEYALETQRRCASARSNGLFADEIAPLDLSKSSHPETISEDEHPRANVSLESLAKLPSVFRREGSIHAGNSAGITDGAAALLLMAEDTAASLGLEPLAWMGQQATTGVSPALMGIAPVSAVQRLCQATGSNLDDFDLIELNEAFAAQVIACDRELGFDRERLNVHGGAIALGHPVGATGARIVVTLVHAMRARSARSGLATLCVSGGLGIATAFHRE